jgi:rod shape-determining protein MreC
MANGTWRIGRGRGGAQLPLVIAAVLAMLLLVAGKAHFVPFERARAALADKTAPALQALNSPAAAVTRWFGGIGHFFDVYSENQRLREENATLLQWRGAALSMQGRLQQYQRLLKAIPENTYSSITAQVIGRSSQPFLETLVLNAGRRNGAKPGQAVIDGRGLIGRIYVAGDHTSWVILLTDLNSRIPVVVRPGNLQAILAGNNASMPGIEALPQNIRLKNDADVVTSGDGGLLPAGLPVGVLRFDGREPKVSPYANPLTASEVRILDFKSPIEQMPKPADQDVPGPGKLSRPPPTPAEATAKPKPLARHPTPRAAPVSTAPVPEVIRPARRHGVTEPPPDAGPQTGETDQRVPETPDDQNDQ